MQKNSIIYLLVIVCLIMFYISLLFHFIHIFGGNQPYLNIIHLKYTQTNNQIIYNYN